MIKLLGLRRGKDAQRFWEMAGAKLPDVAPGLNAEFTYTWQETGVIVSVIGLELAKGVNDIRLPTPTLTPRVLLLAGLAPDVQDVKGLTAFMPTGVLGEKTAATIGVRVVITVKEDRTYTGPIAEFHLLTDR